MKKSIILLSITFLLTGLAGADLIYREVFPNNTGDNMDLSGAGWVSYGGSSGAAITYSGSGANMALSGTTGSPTNLVPVNSSPANDELVRGFIYDNVIATSPQLIYTTEINVGMTTNQITQISWYQYSNAADPIRAAVRVDGVWYASSQTFTYTSGWGQQTLNFTNTSWLALSFTPGSTLALGGATTLTGTNFQGVGFFIPTLTDKMRLDNVEIQIGGKVPVAGKAPWLPAEIISNPGVAYGDAARTWQGIPGIERAANGRLWAVWYSGGMSEGHDGNYALAATSGDNGKNWSPPVVVIQGPTANSLVVDPLPWIDPRGRLWIFYHQLTMPSEGVQGFRGTFAIRTDTPGAADPVWSEPVLVYANGVLFGKPITRADGGWVAPFFLFGDNPDIKETCTLLTKDEGATWSYLGGTSIPKEIRNYSEATLARRADDSLWMVIRRIDGLHQSSSVDGGETWSKAEPFWEGPQTRACMKKLASGAYLLIYHDVTERISNGQYPRAKLTAWLSDDEGRSWPHKLLLDDWIRVSYPDAVQAPDGRIYIAYDHDRYHPVENGGKEIRLAIIREEDIRAGQIVSPDSVLKLRVNRAAGYGNTLEQNAAYREAFQYDTGPVRDIASAGWTAY